MHSHILSRLILPVLLVITTSLTSAGPAKANHITDTDRTAIQQVIASQLAAFRADDAATAYSFASATIQTKFRDPDNFLKMVKLHYDPVYRPASYDFYELLEQDGQVAQAVLIVDRRGKSVMAIYPMEKDETGIWRIAGCHLVDPPGAGA